MKYAMQCSDSVYPLYSYVDVTSAALTRRAKDTTYLIPFIKKHRIA